MGDRVESGLITKRKELDLSIAAWTSRIHSAVGGMPSQSTHDSTPRASNAAWRRRTKGWSALEYERKTSGMTAQPHEIDRSGPTAESRFGHVQRERDFERPDGHRADVVDDVIGSMTVPCGS